MRRLIAISVIAVVLLSLLGLAVSSQERKTPSDAIAAGIRPLLVNIRQRVPLSVTLSVPIGPTSTQTVTLPLDIEINLQIGLAERVTATLETITPTVPAVVEVLEPTPTPTTPAAAGIPRVVDDEDQIQDRGGVMLHIRSVGLVDWEAAKTDKEIAKLENFSAFKEATVLGAISVIVTNTTDSKINIYPDQGTVVIGSEQVDLSSFLFFSDDVGGEIYPGVAKDGVIMFALKRTPWKDIKDGVDILYEVDPPHDERFHDLADEPYSFTLHLQPEGE